MNKDIILSGKNDVMILDGETLMVGQILLNRDRVAKIIGFSDDGKYKCIMMLEEGEEREIGEGDFKNFYTLIKDVDYDEAEDLAEKIIKGEVPLSDLQTKEKQEAGLMVVNASLYEKRRDELALIKSRLDVVHAMVKAKTEAMRRNINGIIQQYGKIISKLNKIIFTLELYGGIEESVKHIQQGENAPDEEPIHLMQLRKYMDEEVGDPENGGVSYDSLEKFDAWLLSYNKFLGYHNYELLIPFKKGVRAMRVRRSAQEKYTSDPFNNQWEIKQEMNTYIIIRNGTNFYTIDSKMQFGNKLFPDIKELTDFYEKGGDFFEDSIMETYKHGMILMQGLIDRTAILGNLSGKVSFLKNDSVEKGDVVFNYENDDKLITDGSLSSLDFLNTSTIQAGDRVLVYSPRIGYRAERLYKQWFQNKYRHPSPPDTGIYKLEYDKGYKCLYFRYIPDDEIWSENEGLHKRKKGFSYKINPSDSNLVNIDIVSHRNIEWITKMMYDRRDRRQYLRAAGLLKAVQKFKKEELEKEEPFKNMVMSVCKVEELTALDAIHWWKTKNKHKRPLFIDDTKALRMISKKIKTEQ